METTSLKDRMKLQEDAIFEDDENVQEEDGMPDEDLKIESLKIATNIAKLMSNVTTEDIVNIAETIAKFIKGGNDTELEVSDAEDSDVEDSESEKDFETDEDEDTNENSEETTEENFEV